MTTISSQRRFRADAFSIVLPVLAFLVIVHAPAHAETAPLSVAGPGWLATAPDGVSAEERFLLNKDVVSSLLGSKWDEEVALLDFPVAPGLRSGVRLTRRDVYAPGAVVWRVEDSGMKELPRSRLAFLWGEADDAARSRVLAIVDPDAGTMQTFVATSDGWNVVEPDTGSPGGYRVAPSRALLGDLADSLTRECGEETLDPVPAPAVPSTAPAEAPSGVASPSGASAISSSTTPRSPSTPTTSSWRRSSPTTRPPRRTTSRASWRSCRRSTSATFWCARGKAPPTCGCQEPPTRGPRAARETRTARS